MILYCCIDIEVYILEIYILEVNYSISRYRISMYPTTEVPRQTNLVLLVVLKDQRHGGFLNWGYPNSWMVYKGKSY